MPEWSLLKQCLVLDLQDNFINTGEGNRHNGQNLIKTMEIVKPGFTHLFSKEIRKNAFRIYRAYG